MKFLNLKPNLWTLLFVICGIWQFVNVNKSSKFCIPTKKCGKIPDYRLPNKEAKICIQDYDLYQKGRINVVNSDVKYFTLPRCEMAEMLRDIGADASVKAHLAVKKEKAVNGLDSNSIILVFEDYLSSKDSDLTGGINYFDFTTPCPNVCDE